MKTTELIKMLNDDLTKYGDLEVFYLPIALKGEGQLLLDFNSIELALRNRGKSYE